MSTFDSCVKFARRKLSSSWSLSFLLVAVVLVPFLVTAGVTGWYSIRLLENHTRDRMQEDIELIARAIRLPLSHAMQRGHEGTVKQALESAFTIDRVYGIYVYDQKGNIIYASGSIDAAMGKQRAQSIAEAKDNQSEFVHANTEEVFSFYIPLVDAGERINGLLQVTRRGRDFDNYLGKVRQQSLVVILVSILALSIVITIGHRWAIGRHLASVKRGLMRIRTDELNHRLTPSGPVELRLLATSINEMLDAIESSHQELAAQQQREAALKERLHRSEKLAALGQLAAGVAHELGSPLSIVYGQAQRALRDAELPEKLRQTLLSVRSQTSRMERIIRQLLDFGRTSPPSKRKISAIQPLVSALNTIEAEAVPKKMLTFQPGSGVHEKKVMVDPFRLEQALLNLLRNAFYEARAKVTVSCNITDDAVHYVVEDDGRGIDENVRPHLFEPFFTTKPTGQGTGLGLAVAQAAALDHGGYIQVDSRQPGNTRFCLVLPFEETTANE